ncbi:MAG TPA: AAA family ATPase [Actinomycetes bacterium]|nr:AAA family ATPase [Actinomycetes bacterium]
MASVEELKVVTVVCCDVADSTLMLEQLGPAGARRLLDRFQETAASVVRTHGGETGKLLGDSILAVFGVPILYGDDALRAVRAASELRDAVAAFSDKLKSERGIEFRVRIGVDTGKALVNSVAASLEERVAGQVVNVATRLQSQADPYQVLISVNTHQLVRNQVQAEDIGRLQLKGITEAVPAYRLIRVEESSERRSDGPIVGRDQDLSMLGYIFDRTVLERSCHLITILGAAGVGKTRLVDEFARTIGERALILKGECLSSGEGITFFPVVQIVRAAAKIDGTDPPEVVGRKLDALLSGEKHADRIALTIAQLLGSTEEAKLPGDTYWALQRLLEGLARQRPLIVVFDGLQWAEAALLDAIEHIAASSRETTMLVVCMARPAELVTKRKRWMGGTPNTFSLLLSPLRDEDSDRLIEHLLDGRRLEDDKYERVLQSAQGHPLYLHEYVRMLRDEDAGQLQVPLSVQAVLEERLERLEGHERDLLQRAAVVGEQFHSADVVALSDQDAEPKVPATLNALVRHDVIRLDSTGAMPLPAHSGEGYRFRHILLRDAAYGRLTEQDRAELHERYAGWLEQQAGDRLSQFDEMIGHHLLRSYRYKQEHWLSDEDGRRELARRAGERLAVAGQRAAVRGDVQVTLDYLRRAVDLLPREHPRRLHALLDLADALLEQDLDQAAQTYAEARQTAATLGEEGVAMHAVLGELYFAGFQDPKRVLQEGRHEAERAIGVFDTLGDRLGLAKAWRILAWVHHAEGHNVQGHEAATRACELARQAQDERWEAKVRRFDCVLVYWGPQPVPEIVEYAERTLAWARDRDVRDLQAGALTILARAEAMQGDFDQARRHSAQANAIKAELGETLTAAAESITEAMVEQLAGNLEQADGILRRGEEVLRRMGGTGPLVNVIAMRARLLLQQGRDEEAEAITRECERLVATDQLDSRIKWRSIRAVVLARRGELAEAHRLAMRAIQLAEQTDQPETEAEAFLDLAEVLAIEGRRGEAERAVAHALDLYQNKGNETAARRARRRLPQLVTD